MAFDSNTRRDVLKYLAVSGAGVAGIGGLGTGIASAESCDFSCDDGIYVKYELVEQEDGTCTFVEETDTGIYGSSLTITETKDGDTCEPITVTWDNSGFVASKVTAFGGDDCDTVNDPGGVYTAEGEGDDGLDTPSGKTAAISNLQFCVNLGAIYVQADFVKGDPIHDLCEDSYGSDKISSVSWSSADGQLDGVQGQFDGSWVFDDDEIHVEYDPTDYDQKVSLAVYQVDDPVFLDGGNIDFSATRCRQTLISSDTDEVGNQDGTLTAALPPL